MKIKIRRSKKMVKGCQRQMVVLKCAPESAFESAYFILRNERQRSVSQEDILAQANRIIRENCFVREKKKRRREILFAAISFLCGALVSALVTLAVFLAT